MAHKNVLVTKTVGNEVFELNFRCVDVTQAPTEADYTSLNYDELTTEEKAVVDNFKALAEARAV